MATKITKKENFKVIVGILEELGRTDLVDVMNHEIELLDKKAQSGKLTKTQEENVGIKELIISELVRLARPVSVTELIAESPELAQKTNSSNQKVSALITQMLVKNGGTIVRSQEGKKAVFTVAE